MFMPPPNQVNFTPPPAGTHIAICYRVIDLGTQNSAYMGNTKEKKKLLISWELPNETYVSDADGVEKNHTVHQRYTFSSHPKASLRKDLESWRGVVFKDEEIEAFDVRNLLGKPCLLTLVHSDDGQYANIAAISAMMRGQAAPPMSNKPVSLQLLPDAFDEDVFGTLSDKLKDTIENSPEYKAILRFRSGDDERPTSPPEPVILDDDIPF